MPKNKRGYSHCSKRSRKSPYQCSSGSRALPTNVKESVENIKEWEEARCPVCMEHPHNAVLLVCSSRDKGCHPYMCDTSHRHSNCLDQFCKTFAKTPISPTEEESIGASSRNRDGVANQNLLSDDKRLVCPLCRGQVNGWIVVEGARRLMNEKIRNCACETCDFSGSYRELRMHARVDHPLVRPSEVDPDRQHDWTIMEQEREWRDLFSTFGTQEDGMDGNESGRAVFSIRSVVLEIYFVTRGSEARSSQARSSSSSSSSRRLATSSSSRSGWMEVIDTDLLDLSEDGDVDVDVNSDSDDGGWTPEYRRSRESTPEENNPNSENHLRRLTEEGLD